MRYVIGDIHGCYKTFRKLTEEILKIRKQDEIYLLGDYIDRGPSSKQVIDYILDLQEKGYSVFPIRGNHEEMLTDAFLDQSTENFMLWMMNGADTTFQSYDIESYNVMGSASLNELPEEHISFVRKLPYYIQLEDFIIVHAGINFNAKDPYKDFRSMVWCRDCENNKALSGGRVIIHGHTPRPHESLNKEEIEGSLSQINLDTGCVYKGMPGMGNLTALELDTKKVFSAENIDF